MRSATISALDRLPDPARDFLSRRLREIAGGSMIVVSGLFVLSLATWSVQDPSLNYAAEREIQNLLGKPGAISADLLMQTLGLASVALLIPAFFWGWQLLTQRRLGRFHLRFACAILGTIALAGFLSLLPPTARWPMPSGMGGVVGDAFLAIPGLLTGGSRLAAIAIGVVSALAAILLTRFACSQTADPDYGRNDADLEEQQTPKELKRLAADDQAVIDPHGEPGIAIIALGAIAHLFMSTKSAVVRMLAKKRSRADSEAPDTKFESELVAGQMRQEKIRGIPDDYNASIARERNPVAFERHRVGEAPADLPFADQADEGKDVVRPSRKERETAAPQEFDVPSRVAPAVNALKPGKRILREAQPSIWTADTFELPTLTLLAEPKRLKGAHLSEDALEQNARLLEGVLEDFGVRGEIIHVRPGPVVTLYELEPAPGIKSSRVIGLADDIARSMSAISARVAVVQGRNAIGIELPNQQRETVYLRELLASEQFEKTKAKLAICLGKKIGGEPVIADLARMPHLLVAGTTGSGKSVAINTMILSLLYRLDPDQCKLIMIDPKMLELSVYDGIPHLLTPVVTDPKKAVVALKWAVREMEDRYKKMSKLGVRNIEGFNTKVAEAQAKNKKITRRVQTGFDRETGEAIFEEEEFDLGALPFIVVIVDEMADLMMVAGKDIEGAIQRLAQMARAAGIHLIMATQRPSVDVITGTIKANFPTRISFQVTSKIDSRTILGEQGAEQLLGQGDMLYMEGGGRISRVHGPFVSDHEVEDIVAHLKQQGQPDYLDAITDEPDEDADDRQSGGGGMPGTMDEEEAMSLYDRAVAIVLRDRKCSTSYIQRRLSVGYNKAASLVEQMEREGVVSPANHAGKREILVGGGIDRGAFDPDDED